VLLDALEAGAPGALAVNAYLNADGTEASIVQLMRDANSIKDFWRILHQHTGRSLGELADTTDVQVFGSVGDIAIERTRHSLVRVARSCRSTSTGSHDWLPATRRGHDPLRAVVLSA
jgi:hypothetical protein